MKKICYSLFLTLLCLAGSQRVFAIGDYSANDKLTVWAKTGLTMRQTADSKGEKITAVPFGAVVTVLKETLKTKPYSVTEFKGYELKGFWVKVQYGKMTGYVFDGYLSKLVAPAVEAEGAKADSDMFDQYYKRNAKRKGERVDQKSQRGNPYECYEQAFEDGTTLKVDIGEGGSSRVLTFKKGITLEEAFLMGRALWFQAGDVVTYRRDAKKGSIEGELAGGLSVMSVSRNANGRVEAKFEYAD